MRIITESNIYFWMFIVVFCLLQIGMYVFRCKRYNEYKKLENFLKIFTELPFKMIYYITIIYILVSIFENTILNKCSSLNIIC